jgi:N-acetylglucosamine-6-sulfatase
MTSRRLAAALLGLALLVALGASIGGHSTSQSQASTTAKPNVVLVLTDDQSYDALAQMPFVKGRSDWFRFNNAFFNNPLCCPSRATLLTGLYSHHTGVETNNDGAKLDDSSTLATWLHSAGYRTALVGKYLNDYPWTRGNFTPPGWDHWVAFKKSVGYYNYSLNIDGTTVKHGSDPSDYSTDVLGAEAKAYVSSATQPFFLYFAPNAPHAPITPAPRDQDTYANRTISRTPNFNEADVSDKPAWVRSLPALKSGNEMDRLRRVEYETLKAVDKTVADIFTALKDRGILDNTVVIFMTDNGYSFGEHRWKGKRCAYEECIRTPLLIRYPGGQGGSSNALVSNVDIAPTIAEFAGVTPPKPVDGYSLVNLLTHPNATIRTTVLLRGKHDDSDSEEGDGFKPPSFWGVRTTNFKYIETVETGEVELYDLRNDSYELDNVATKPDYKDDVTRLHQKLRDLRGY